MPEAPQMQALAERIEAAAGGHTLKRIEPMQFAALKTFDPDPMSLRGRTLGAVARRGKFLVLDFGDGLRVLVHLSQGGRVDIEHIARKWLEHFRYPRLSRGLLTVEGFGFVLDESLVLQDRGNIVIARHQPDLEAVLEHHGANRRLLAQARIERVRVRLEPGAGHVKFDDLGHTGLRLRKPRSFPGQDYQGKGEVIQEKYVDTFKAPSP